MCNQLMEICWQPFARVFKISLAHLSSSCQLHKQACKASDPHQIEAQYAIGFQSACGVLERTSGLVKKLQVHGRPVGREQVLLVGSALLHQQFLARHGCWLVASVDNVSEGHRFAGEYVLHRRAGELSRWLKSRVDGRQ